MNKVTERLRVGRMEMFPESFRAAVRSDPSVQMGRKGTCAGAKEARFDHAWSYFCGMSVCFVLTFLPIIHADGTAKE